MKTKVEDIEPYTSRKREKTVVNQFALSGKYLKTFESISAAAKATDTTCSGIWLCVNGRGQSANSFQWKKA